MLRRYIIAALLFIFQINDMTLPVLKKSTSLSTESGKAVSDLKKFLLEFEGVAREGNLILFEAHWPILVINLHSCLEQCVSTSNKSLSVEVSGVVMYSYFMGF